MTSQCRHLAQIQEVTPSAGGCEDCMKTGDTWVHLRLCETCGHVGCCDNSKNKHATKHFHKTNHPIIKSPNRQIDRSYLVGTFNSTSIAMTLAPLRAKRSIKLAR